MDRITLMIIGCISLCLRNDIIGFDFLNAESGQKDFKFLQEYFKEFFDLVKQGQIMNANSLNEIEHMNGLFMVFR